MPEPSLKEKMQELLDSAKDEAESDLYLINYDLIDKEPKDYKKLKRALKQMKAKRVLRSQWAIRLSNTTAEAIRNKLYSSIDTATDRLVVVKITDQSTLNPLTELGGL